MIKTKQNENAKATPWDLKDGDAVRVNVARLKGGSRSVAGHAAIQRTDRRHLYFQGEPPPFVENARRPSATWMMTPPHCTNPHVCKAYRNLCQVTLTQTSQLQVHQRSQVQLKGLKLQHFEGRLEADERLID